MSVTVYWEYDGCYLMKIVFFFIKAYFLQHCKDLEHLENIKTLLKRHNSSSSLSLFHELPLTLSCLMLNKKMSRQKSTVFSVMNVIILCTLLRTLGICLKKISNNLIFGTRNPGSMHCIRESNVVFWDMCGLCIIVESKWCME